MTPETAKQLLAYIKLHNLGAIHRNGRWWFKVDLREIGEGG